jgi:inner membrane protein
LDNVTHAALGFAIAEAAFPSLGRSGLALAVVASELPDIDIFFGLGNPWSMVTTHRAITHSIFVAPLAAAALAGLWTWFSSAGGFRTFFLLALACLAGHIFLDVLTTYGTQILEPFSQRRFGLGWVAVIDPVVTVSLLIGGLAAWWIRAGSPAAANRAALAGLLVAAGYVGLGAWQHARAMGVLARQTAALGKPLAADATPQLGTIFLWRLLYKNDDTFWVARYNGLTGQLGQAHTLPAGLDPSLAPLLEVPRAKVFRAFAGGLIRPHVDPDDAGVLVLEDMRFSWPTGSPTGLWALRMEFEPNGQAVPEVRRVEFVQRQLRFGGDGPVRERTSPVPIAVK